MTGFQRLPLICARTKKSTKSSYKVKIFSGIFALFIVQIVTCQMALAQVVPLNSHELLIDYNDPLDSTCMSPFCQLELEQKVLIPESVLHDPVPEEARAPHTFLFIPSPLPIKDIDPKKYGHIDPGHLIPRRPLQVALTYFDQLKAQLKNTKYLTVVNFREHSHIPRLFVINMKTGAVESSLVAHGEFSDTGNTGYATRFSNVIDSHKSSLGAYVTAEPYDGNSGYSMRLDGIEPTNSNVRERAIVFHGSNKVDPKFNPIGLSWGCPAVSYKFRTKMLDSIKEGSLLFAWYNQ